MNTRIAKVDFPTAVVSKHSTREKSIRHGHPSTLHLWWARRFLTAYRAMLMALLLPDPCDAKCPEEFRTTAGGIVTQNTGMEYCTYEPTGKVRRRSAKGDPHLYWGFRQLGQLDKSRLPFGSPCSCKGSPSRRDTAGCRPLCRRRVDSAVEELFTNPPSGQLLLPGFKELMSFPRMDSIGCCGVELSRRQNHYEKGSSSLSCPDLGANRSRS